MEISKYFYITTSDDEMYAYINCTDLFEKLEEAIDQVEIIRFINESKINYGIMTEAIREVISARSSEKFPIMIAEGTRPVAGLDGSIQYHVHRDLLLKNNSMTYFKERMQVLRVKKGEKLATLTEAVAGIDGTTVTGKKVAAKEGNEVYLKAGENVHYVAAEKSFYAAIDGEVDILNNELFVVPIDEFSASDFKTAEKIESKGTIVVHGDVVANCEIHAAKDVKIFGIVEAAKVIAGGSLYISEGFAGMGRGKISAQENIYLGYINQGHLECGKNIYVENSVVHSIMDIKGSAFCLNGHIIGGSLTVGKSVKASDIGNRLSTETLIYFYQKPNISEKEKLKKKRAELEHKLDQLKVVGESLKKQSDVKSRIMLLKQRNSLQNTERELEFLNQKITELKSSMEMKERQEIIATGTLYANVIIKFGKYKQEIEKVHHEVSVVLKQREIVVQPIENLHNGADQIELEIG